MTKESASDNLLEFLSSELGVAKTRLTDDTSLFHDLGVAGLDGVALLAAMGSRFSLDMSRVDPDRYFGEERPYSPIFHLWCFLRRRRLDEGIVRLEISDLRRAVAAGRWRDPIEKAD